MSNDIIAHEYAHVRNLISFILLRQDLTHRRSQGITNRIVGGGTGLCFITPEANGLGEGWADALAFWMAQKDSNVQDFTIGKYATYTDKGEHGAVFNSLGCLNSVRQGCAGSRIVQIRTPTRSSIAVLLNPGVHMVPDPDPIIIDLTDMKDSLRPW